MAAMHVVALFLPNTLKFDSDYSKAPSPPPAVVEAETEAPTAGKRSSMRLELPRSLSAISLVSGTTPPLTPSIANQAFFTPVADETNARQFATCGDPHSLVQNDAEVPTWGIDQPFNQPRSTAAPLPSGSILDFPKVRDELEELQKHTSPQKLKAPAATRSSTRDHSYDSKTWNVEPPVHGNGALTNAIRAYASSSDIEVSWIGTLGFPTDSIPIKMRQEISDHLLNHYKSEVVYTSDKDLNGHYSGYCKTILWPIFHYQVPDHPKSKAYADHSWEFYENVNQAFADKVVESYKRGDTIWVHDYHLLLVPGMVRTKLPDARIGFFLHTAFPSSEIFRILPKRKELLQGVLGANLVAFQTKEYLDHFLQTCNRILTVETTKETVKFGDRTVNVAAQPIGINPSAMREARNSDEVQTWINTLQNRFKDRKIIVNRSKLDNVHGIRQGLLAYELFLNKYPAWADKTTFIQVATSTTEEAELMTTVFEICERIDKFHANLTNTPLVFLKQDIDFSQYLALLMSADVLVSSSLRDGMNLIGAEYVHCQDGALSAKKHGPLIVSEFTGSAAIMRGQLSINPWNFQQMAKAINQALEMNDAEKEQRWKCLHQCVSRHTGSHWAEQLNHTLAKVYDEQNSRAPAAVPRLSTKDLDVAYKDTQRRFFLIDLEGTLTHHKDDRDGVLTAPVHAQHISRITNSLTGDSRNTVYVMSGLSTKELDSCFWWGTKTGLIAENGCFIRNIPKEPNQPKWEAQVDLGLVREWKKAVRSFLEHFQNNMEGAEIEERQCSFVFNYEKVADQSTAQRQAGDLAEQINGSCKTMGVHAIPIAKTLIVEHSNVNKSSAAAKVFDALFPQQNGDEEVSSAPDFVMVAGNDRDDEVAFRWANDLAKHGTVPHVFTVSLGRRNTEAKAALAHGPTALHSIIHNFGYLSVKDLPVEDWSWLYKYREERRSLLQTRGEDQHAVEK